ncbi:hypothetical protein [Thioalkalivibrio sp. XN8]|uniref:hypothetical protein n=1 Tax=Thioalkalivibrio sp. XN8 TaxID=2712863 RepID=UPI0013ECB8CF|nr:hypothetical protein [Thioalkalivibrio sp. XN8]NGP52762.1 hypothetical protein [Thioalkalivibrio sp. XN8]
MLGARKILLVLVAGLAASLALAGPGGGGGGKGGGGGGGPGGGGGGDGSGKPGATVDDFYGDMALVDRDVDGVPILAWGLGPKDKYMWVRAPIVFPDKLGTTECPLTAEELDLLAADPSSDYVILGTGSVYAELGIDAYRIPLVDGEVPESSAGCVTEADFGRLSAVRSPPKVLDAALLELVTTLSTEAAVVGLDEAGRVMVTYEEDDLTVVKTIDAPRENLAGFERLLETAGLSHPEVNGGAGVEDLLPERPDRSGDVALRRLDRAAAMFGAAADKFHPMGLDELMYVVALMEIGDDMTAEAKGIFGEPNIGQEEGKTPFLYFDFSTFSYDRAATYAGDVCYLKVMNVSGTDPAVVTAEVVSEPILQVVFPALPEGAAYPAGGFFAGAGDGYSYTGFIGSNAWGFSRAVDDARAVINWVHENPMPVELLEYCP